MTKAMIIVNKDEHKGGTEFPRRVYVYTTAPSQLGSGFEKEYGPGERVPYGDLEDVQTARARDFIARISDEPGWEKDEEVLVTYKGMPDSTINPASLADILRESVFADCSEYHIVEVG